MINDTTQPSNQTTKNSIVIWSALIFKTIIHLVYYNIGSFIDFYVIYFQEEVLFQTIIILFLFTTLQQLC